MKSAKILGLVFSLAILLAPAAHAQFAVFDASNFGEAVQEFGQLQQMYTTAVETRDQIVSAYNLAYQMSQMPQDMAARYATDFTLWLPLRWLTSTNTADGWPRWGRSVSGGRKSASQRRKRQAATRTL